MLHDFGWERGRVRGEGRREGRQSAVATAIVRREGGGPATCVGEVGGEEQYEETHEEPA